MRPWNSQLVALLALLIGCGTSTVHEQAGTTGTTGTSALLYAPDWVGVTAFTDASCAVCHSIGGTAEGIVLPDALRFDLATESGLYVVPFDPAASRLWRVLSGDLVDGDFGVMPQGTGPLPEEHIGHIKLWIETGAPFPPMELDLDGDGFTTSDDCDDSDPLINPNAAEVCDAANVDENCDGLADAADAEGATTWFADGDLDGFGLDSDTLTACDQPDGYTMLGGDCNDGDTAFNPGADESDCSDPTDYNCDGSAGSDDNDGDGFSACEECNDADAQSFPGAEELCDGLDNDCDGLVDNDATDATIYWNDGDGDGYGAGAPFADCSSSSGWVTNGGDCDDIDAATNPSAIEIPDGVDNNCNGQVDESAGALSFATHLDPFFDSTCAVTCHGAAPGPASGGLDMTNNAYLELVGVPSDDVPSMPRVDPGNPNNSYLWHKLNDTQGAYGVLTGQQMPLNGGPLTSANLGVIEAWILGGALP